MHEEVTFTQLTLDSDYSQFSSFDCDNGKNPDYAGREIYSLSKYLSDIEEGARADLKNGYGVTTVAYVDGEPGGYFTLMASSIFIDRLPKDFPHMHFTCLTYPALKISRIAVDKKFQKKELEPGAYGSGTLHLSDIMLREIASIADSLNRVDVEYTYNKDENDERPNLIGVRFIIADALAIEKTLSFYERLGFITFYDEEKDKNGKLIKGVNKYDIRRRRVRDGTFKPKRAEEMGIPMYRILII